MVNLQQLARALVRDRRTQYVQTFTTAAGKDVLADLARFCRAAESTFHEDDRIAAKLDGRREVWLRIAEHLNLSPEQLYDLYK